MPSTTFIFCNILNLPRIRHCSWQRNISWSHHSCKIKIMWNVKDGQLEWKEKEWFLNIESGAKHPVYDLQNKISSSFWVVFCTWSKLHTPRLQSQGTGHKCKQAPRWRVIWQTRKLVTDLNEVMGWHLAWEYQLLRTFHSTTVIEKDTN